MDLNESPTYQADIKSLAGKLSTDKKTNILRIRKPSGVD